MRKKGLLDASWTSYYEEAINSEDEPYFGFINAEVDKHGGIAVDYVDGSYRLWILSSVVEETPALREAIDDVGDPRVAGDYLLVGIARSKLKNTLYRLTAGIKPPAEVLQ